MTLESPEFSSGDCPAPHTPPRPVTFPAAARALGSGSWPSCFVTEATFLQRDPKAALFYIYRPTATSPRTLGGAASPRPCGRLPALCPHARGTTSVRLTLTQVAVRTAARSGPDRVRTAYIWGACTRDP